MIRPGTEATARDTVLLFRGSRVSVIPLISMGAQSATCIVGIDLVHG